MIESLLADLGVDGLLITSSTNRRYVTGFSGEDHAPDSSMGVVLVTPTATTLYVSATNLPWAQSEVRSGVEVSKTTSSWIASVANDVTEAGIQRLGFEDFTTVVAHYNELLSRIGEVDLIPIGLAVNQLRAIKSPEEIEWSQRALAITDEAFVAASEQLVEGMTERELVDIVERELRKAGSDGLAFDVIVASGPNAAKPHHAPGDRRIQSGEPVIIDMGGRFNGYRGDLTRTIWLGQPSEQLVTMYQIVAEAQAKALAAAKPGMTGRELDAVARDFFASKGLGEFFVHGLGHGVGLRIHELPSLSTVADNVLVPGNIITIEPGLYDPTWGGVRIEDVILIEESGARNLTTAPKRDPLA